MELTQGFMIGSAYTREEIHSRYGGQRGSRISTPKAMPVVILFAGSRSRDHVAADAGHAVSWFEEGWREDGFYHFRGERRMQFVRGNRAVRDHARDGKLLMLFEEIIGEVDCYAGRLWRYVGPMECAGYYFRPASSGKAGVTFRLAPVRFPGLNSPSSCGYAVADYAADFDRPHVQKPLAVGTRRNGLAFLQSRHSAIAAGVESARPGYHGTARSWLEDCATVQRYALDRALGFCESCGRFGPFADEKGDPYLEVHYVLRPYDSGVDPVHYVAACCPECHRRIHHASDGHDFDVALARRIALVERCIDKGELLTVTAGVIRNEDGKVLLTQRGHGSLLGKWEFPGGKVEDGETLGECLTREIREELDMEIAYVQPLALFVHSYGDFTVRLFGLSARAVGDRVELREHNSMAWIEPSELSSYDLAPADIGLAEVMAEIGVLQ